MGIVFDLPFRLQVVKQFPKTIYQDAKIFFDNPKELWLQEKVTLSIEENDEIEILFDSEDPEAKLYLEALDRDVKKKNENPSVGVILCSSKDKNIVEYSLSKNMSQTLISEYKLKLIDKKLLENKLSEMNRILENEN